LCTHQSVLIKHTKSVSFSHFVLNYFDNGDDWESLHLKLCVCLSVFIAFTHMAVHETGKCMGDWQLAKLIAVGIYLYGFLAVLDT